MRASRRCARRAVARAGVAFTSGKIGQSVYPDARADLSIEQTIVVDPWRTVLQEHPIASSPDIHLRLHAHHAQDDRQPNKLNNAGALRALSYSRSRQWTVMRMRIDIKRCGEFATTALGHFGAPTQR